MFLYYGLRDLRLELGIPYKYTINSKAVFTNIKKEFLIIKKLRTHTPTTRTPAIIKKQNI